MRIVSLQAENFKRLVAVDITPDQNVVVLSGRNHQGKTSILDAIYAVLKGAKFAKETSNTIRAGEDQAWVRLEIGDDANHIEYIATRRWSKDDTGTLTVESADRAKHSSPQKLLDSIVGEVSFDPQQFLDMDPRGQVDALVKALGDALPFDPADLAARRKGIFDRRTEVGRKVRELEGQLAGYPHPDPTLPAEEVSAADLVADAEALRAHNAEVDARLDRADRATAARENAESDVAAAEESLRAARQRLANVSAAEAAAREDAAKITRVDEGDLAAKLAELEQTNARIRQEQHRAAVAAELSDRKQEVAQHTLALQAIDKQKAEGIAAAKFPVPELSFDDTGVLYDGRAFSQASTEEQLRAAFGVAIAANPKLRVCRIDKGESLDSDGLARLTRLAAEYDVQVWLSRVTDGAGIGFLIEEGTVRS